jgi:acetolactate synthase-1/2/3 large subunit
MTARRLLSQTVPVPHAIAQVLEEAGVRFVFGMPGGRTIPIYDALYDRRPGIRTVLAREEGLAAVMADAHGRLTGTPAVAMGQAAFMLTNSGMGIVEAYLAGSPMLVIADLSDGFPFTQHGPYQSGSGDFGSWDARDVIRGYTKQVFVARDPASAVQSTQLALKHATSGQPGPVALLFHSAALAASVGPETTPRLYATEQYLPERHEADAASIDAAIEALAGASRPVILAGNGVRMSAAQARLRELAELLGAPVATTASGKGTFPETHPLALGVFGNFGLEAANVLVADADLVLAVGTKLGPTDTANENPALLDPERQVFLQVDVEPRHAAWSFPAQQALIGDATAVLTQLIDAAKQAELPGRADGPSEVAAAHAQHASFNVEASSSDARPILPQRLIADLGRAAPDDCIITCDAGENRLFMMHHFQTKGSIEYLQPAAVGGMGYALPAALAAKLVHPERGVIAVCGDGGFGIAMNGLLTAIEERLNIVTVVMNNSALGWVRHGQGERPIASDFAAFDYAAIARAMGCEAYRVEDPAEIEPSVRKALACGKPAVVEVITSLDAATFRDVSSPLAAYPPR